LRRVGPRRGEGRFPLLLIFLESCRVFSMPSKIVSLCNSKEISYEIACKADHREKSYGFKSYKPNKLYMKNSKERNPQIF
jgi:hypothetical protein